jgi:ParB family chromosome partitioning protein
MPKGKTQKEHGQSSKKHKKVALGRGLDALLPEIEGVGDSSREYFQCDIEQIRPNRYQPRLRFADTELEELSRSIKEQGVLQPLIVRKDKNGYELAMGERRLRAAKMAGLQQVPVVLKNISDSDLLEMSIVENVQREDLNPMEEAEAYHRLIAEFDLTQDKVATRVGKSRSAVANFLRLRQLPEQIQTSLRDGSLSMGHARTILGADSSAQQRAIWRTVVSKKLSVRETELLIKRLKAEKKKPKKSPSDSKEIYFSDVADNLSRYFGTRVQIKYRGKRGKVEIEFYSNEDLDRLIRLLQER